MEYLTSRDGTRIAYRQTGEGPPLVLVHGTTSDHTRWAPILPELEQRFRVYAIDRRGRGESDDAADYTIEREFEDVAAVVDSIAEPVNLLGHSYGAICSLEAARRTRNLRKLVLYEPPIPTGIEIYPRVVVDRLQALLDAGERDAVVTTFLREIVRAPASEIEMMRSLPTWPSRVAAAHTIPREMRGSESYQFVPEEFQDIQVPVLLLLGGDSPTFFKTATETVHAALPDSRIVVMPGQQHVAMNTAPEHFVREVIRFLTNGE